MGNTDIIFALIGAFTAGGVVMTLISSVMLSKKLEDQDDAFREEMAHARNAACAVEAELIQKIERLVDQKVDAINALRGLENNLDRLAEEKAKKIIRDWEPDQTTIDEDFEKAERMALKREALRAGRIVPPRADGGDHATVSKLTFRTRKVPSNGDRRTNH